MLADSELILNQDGSIYHLNLLPKDIANTIVLVGDPERVVQVSSFFDSIEIKKRKREFVTHTGYLNKKRISVISTGIGTDNIDIVLNELDALVNIDFKTRQIKKELTSLDLVRIGTSGSIQPDIKIDSFLISRWALGFDNLPYFYAGQVSEKEFIKEDFLKYTDWYEEKSKPYVVGADTVFLNQFVSERTTLGFTATAVGFYGPQSRKLRLSRQDPHLNEKLATVDFKNFKVTNLEMETAGIYTMSKLLGHRAVSLNCILANRPNKSFSSNPNESINKLIEYTLNRLVKEV